MMNAPYDSAPDPTPADDMPQAGAGRAVEAAYRKIQERNAASETAAVEDKAPVVASDGAALDSTVPADPEDLSMDAEAPEGPTPV